MENFSDFSDEKVLEGDKMKINDILNEDLIILGYKINNSKFNDKECLTIQFELNEIKHVLFTGSAVLKNQIEKYKDKIPFKAKISKINKYYTFS